ncbi:MAG: damage-control phosphatase ARMT1 family protein [Anaerolineae bacterium]
MRTYLDCYPCFLRQALDGARHAGADQEQQQRVVAHILNLLTRIEPSRTPPEIGDEVYRVIRRICGTGDPYRGAKEASTNQALALYPELKARVQEAADPLDTALRLSIAGNIIDLGPGHVYDLPDVIERVLSQPFARDDRTALWRALDQASEVLYLADNAGETVFDRILIEALDVPVTYAVKGGPVLNDATLEDARAAGLDRVATLIETGSDAPGTILGQCSPSFRASYDEAELIIAKGQANYETLSGAGPRVFFLLQTKCPVIARDVGVPVSSIVTVQG